MLVFNNMRHSIKYTDGNDSRKETQKKINAILDNAQNILF
jgi:hypothetical protein